MAVFVGLVPAQLEREREEGREEGRRKRRVDGGGLEKWEEKKRTWKGDREGERKK